MLTHRCKRGKWWMETEKDMFGEMMGLIGAGNNPMVGMTVAEASLRFPK